MTAAEGAGSPSTNTPGLTGLTKDVGDAIWKDAGCAASTTSAFQIASPKYFLKPVNHGVLILGYPAPSETVIISLTSQHTEDTRVFNEYHSVDRACKKVLCTLIMEAYFRSFKNKYTG